MQGSKSLALESELLFDSSDEAESEQLLPPLFFHLPLAWRRKQYVQDDGLHLPGPAVQLRPWAAGMALDGSLFTRSNSLLMA